MKVLLAAFLIVPLTTMAVAAEILPNGLLFQCTGNARAKITFRKTQTADASPFAIILRLNGGSIIDTDTNAVEGAGCVVINSKIQCEATTLHYEIRVNSTEKRQSTVSINKDTGALYQLVEAWDYDGHRSTGKPSGTLKLLRTGICRIATPA